MDNSSSALLDVQELKLHFFTDEGVVKAVDDVTFSIQRGKTLCVVGESGSGKSVAARAILNMVQRPGKIIGGKIWYHRPQANGSTETIEITALNPQGREIRQIRGNDISMIFQEPMTSLSLMYTVGNQIMEAIRLHSDVSKLESRNRAIELLRRVGIPRPEKRIDEYPFRLSGGMRQRCMIAMALACNPRLLIADEPTTALDVTTQAQILDLMMDLQQDYGMALLLITHDLGVVAEIADDVAVMYLGNVVECSDVDTIFNDPKHPYTQALLNSMPKISYESQRLNPIRGMVPSPFQRPSGCPFHPRCNFRIDKVCDRVVPQRLVLAEGREVRCHLYDPNSNAPVPENAVMKEATHG